MCWCDIVLFDWLKLDENDMLVDRLLCTGVGCSYEVYKTKEIYSSCFVWRGKKRVGGGIIKGSDSALNMFILDSMVQYQP